DLAETERTFGFDTAVSIVSEALDRVHTTAASHHRCIVVETMGRYAGWIALYAGAASGADVILIPEIPFDPKAVCEVVRRRYDNGKVCTIVCAAEGAAPIGGQMVVEKTVAASHDPVRLGGIGKVVADIIEKETKVDSRAVVLGHVQRGGTPTPFDRALATCFGHAAAKMVMTGRFGRMVRMRDGKISDVEISKVADKVRKVPLDEPLLLAARAVGTSFGVQGGALPVCPHGTGRSAQG
ncbi:MAG: 6-phosphofructokinase, partial [Planctomycetota bacterium]|nr:6-phosphofructokinase [Planctomycetota bacterium]